MADKAIGELPKLIALDDDSLFVAEQQGAAGSVSGKLIKELARTGVDAYVQSAQTAAANAQTAQAKAETAATRAEAARDAVEVDQAALSAAVDAAQASAEDAAASADGAYNSALLSRSWAVGSTGAREGEDVDNSKYWAEKAQGYAESASTPAVAGVYNVVLADRVTGDKYALIAEGGRLVTLGVSDTLEATDLTLIDPNTGVAYAVVIDEGRLGTEEV